MARGWTGAALLLLLAAGVAFAVTGRDRDASTGAPRASIVDDVADLVDAGHFAKAGTRIDAALADHATPAADRTALEFERERMRRILLDFTLDAAAVKERVRRQIPDLTDAEFERWDAAGLFERMDIDGRRLYFGRSPSNLFRLSEEALKRRKEQAPLSEGPMESPNAHHRAVRAAAMEGKGPGVLPRRVRFTQSLTVDADAVPAGETVRAWIPYPRAIPGQQDDIRLVSSEPAGAQVAPESTLQRTAYLEARAVAGQPTKFSVTYDVTISAQDHRIDPDKVVPATITPELAPFVAERPPHVVFTDDIRAFSRRIVGDETDPYRVAQKLFAAVDGIPWAGAREYSTIRNISDYALHAGHADCGQQTLLLITLLRLNGIPARWQSGMVWSPAEAGAGGSEGDDPYWNLHDWGFVYLAPYGWVPMDVTTGRFEQEPALEWFYLGGFDGYRIAFNDDYGRDFVPAKQHFRSETVDLQRGEAEWRGGNLYFDQWDYDFAWRELPGEAVAHSR
jgi:transglutaminase-like putative cysteine protease